MVRARGLGDLACVLLVRILLPRGGQGEVWLLLPRLICRPLAWRFGRQGRLSVEMVRATTGPALVLPALAALNGRSLATIGLVKLSCKFSMTMIQDSSSSSSSSESESSESENRLGLLTCRCGIPGRPSEGLCCSQRSLQCSLLEDVQEQEQSLQSSESRLLVNISNEVNDVMVNDNIFQPNSVAGSDW